jgi:hypothetical protein
VKGFDGLISAVLLRSSSNSKLKKEEISVW